MTSTPGSGTDTGWPRVRPKDVVIGAIASDARRLLDVGCGSGRWMRVLDAAGSHVTGLEIDDAKVARARQAEAGPVECGRAEALPFAASTFDAVVFLNSLHHVPVSDQDTALSEAVRVLTPDGLIGVLEPVAHGPAQEVYRQFNDETEVRAAALEALRRCVATGLCDCAEEREFMWPSLYRSLDDLLDASMSVDPSRRASIDRNRTQIEAAFLEHGREGARGIELDQPYRFTLLRRR